MKWVQSLMQSMSKSIVLNPLKVGKALSKFKYDSYQKHVQNK